MIRASMDSARRVALNSLWAVQADALCTRAMSAQAAPSQPLSKGSALSEVTIGRVMKEKAEAGGDTAGLFMVKTSDSVFDAISKMATANVGSIVVMKGDVTPEDSISEDSVAGIITERDYMRKVAVAGLSSKEMRCSSLMTASKQIHSLCPTSSVYEAMAIMEEKNVRHIPVFEKGKLLGMLSVKDIISTLMSEHDTEVESMSSYINVSY